MPACSKSSCEAPAVVGCRENRGQVEDSAGQPIRGLYAAGELVGGIFYHNYPGGTGLTSGAVFGKLAGASAAAALKKK